MYMSNINGIIKIFATFTYVTVGLESNKSNY